MSHNRDAVQWRLPADAAGDAQILECLADMAKPDKWRAKQINAARLSAELHGMRDAALDRLATAFDAWAAERG